MSIAIHESDEHAPFRHKYITATNGTHFIVCGFCKHWINRPLAEKCKCPASCHAQVNGEYIPHPAR